MKDTQKLAIVLDDEAVVRDFLCSILASLGYETKVFGSPMDIPCVHVSGSHECAFSDPPYLLITDLQMPGMNGLEFVLQNTQKGCRIENVAIMSGAWDDEKKSVADALGCKQFCKPFGSSEIVEWVDSLPDA